jgi:hypothetical protein
MEEERKHLDGLPEAHVVRETGAEVPASEKRKPREAVSLIRTKLSVERPRGLEVGKLLAAREPSEERLDPSRRLEIGDRKTAVLEVRARAALP